MPTEILCDIFLDTVKNQNMRLHPYAPQPLYISQVCSRWRTIAHEFHQLWSYLDIEILHNSYHGQPVFWSTLAGILETWLHRSGNCPLNYRMVFRDYRKHVVFPTVETMISMLVAQQHRWRVVEFEWDFYAPQDFPRIIVHNMPLLQSLFLYSGVRLPHKCVNIDTLFSPNLQKYDIKGNFEINSPVFSSCGTVAEDVWRVLEAAPRLTHFSADYSVSLRGWDLKPIPGAHPLVFHDLRTLRLPFKIGLFSMLKLLTLPSLEALSLDESFGLGEGAFLEFIQRSKPPLTFLELEWNAVDGETLLESLRLLPTLESLHLGHIFPAAHILEALAVPGMVEGSTERGVIARHTLCPALRTLSFYVSTRYDPEGQIPATNAMLTLRHEILGSFSSVRLLKTDVMEHLPLVTGQTAYERVWNEFRAGKTLVAESDNPPVCPFSEW